MRGEGERQRKRGGGRSNNTVYMYACNLVSCPGHMGRTWLESAMGTTEVIQATLRAISDVG